MKAFYFLLGLAVAPSAALAQSSSTAPTTPAQAPSCSTAEFRQLDFWVGEWIANWTNADGTKGSGKNRITKDEYGDCVITERFSVDNDSFKGFSISMFVKGANEWRQTWMDNQGGYFNLFGGPKLYPDADFALELFGRKAPPPSAAVRRMAFQDVKPDSFTWRWQGKAKPEDPWKDDWIIYYTRAPKTAAAK